MKGYCKNCGDPIEEGEIYCDNCGRKLTKKEREPDEKRLTGEKVTENVTLCPDGKYRWYYELNMLKNPTILITVLKVMGISAGAVFLFVSIVDLISNGFDPEALLFSLKLLGIMAGIFFVLSLIAYFIVAAIYGFKYVVLFEMDEQQVRHIQCKKQFKKAEAIGWLTMLAGIAAGKPAIAALGMSTAVRSESTSEFENVRTVKIRPRRNVIHVNQLLNKNQVYAEKADFDFVADYIEKHCVNAKIKRRNN